MNPLKVYYLPNSKRKTAFVVLFLLLLFTIFDVEQILYHQHISHIYFQQNVHHPTRKSFVSFSFPSAFSSWTTPWTNNVYYAQKIYRSLFVFFYRIDVVDKKNCDGKNLGLYYIASSIFAFNLNAVRSIWVFEFINFFS